MRMNISFLLLITLLAVSTGTAQKRRKPPVRSKPLKVEPVKPIAPTVGSMIKMVTKNGDQLDGELVDLTAFSIRFKTNNLESTLPLESIASITFGLARGEEEKPEPKYPPVSESFRRDSTGVITAFQTMATETKTGSSYTEYDRQLVQLRRSADRFIQKYCASENMTEARAIALLTGALLDYNAARTIWTLKIGTNGSLAETDSPVVADALSNYPDLRAAAAVPVNRFSADKMIGNLWKKATDKVNLVQALVQ